MEDYILAAIFAIMIMLFFAVFVIKNVIKRINENSRKYFVDKLQEYDYLIDEKKEQLADLQKQINTLQDEQETKKEMEEYKKHKEEIKKTLVKIENKVKDEKEEIIYDIPTPKYRQEEFFGSYKNLKNQFKINGKQILEKFLEEHKNDSKDKEYEKLRKMREQFDEEIVYGMLTLTPEEQYEVIENIVTTDAEKKLVELETYDKESFSIIKFTENLDLKIKQTDPTIYVYVSNEEINYDYLDKRIKTVLYKNMSEGIIIEYQNKMYDYSI